MGLERKDVLVGDVARFLEPVDGRNDRARAGGDDEFVCGDSLIVDAQRMRIDECCVSFVHAQTHLAEVRSCFVLADMILDGSDPGCYPSPLKARLDGFDPEPVGPAHQCGGPARGNKRFAGNASEVEAVPAEQPPFDQRGF